LGKLYKIFGVETAHTLFQSLILKNKLNVNKTIHKKINSLGKEKQQNLQVFCARILTLLCKNPIKYNKYLQAWKKKIFLFKNHQIHICKQQFCPDLYFVKKSTFMTKPLLHFTTIENVRLINTFAKICFSYTLLILLSLLRGFLKMLPLWGGIDKKLSLIRAEMDSSVTNLTSLKHKIT
jgi:hypothetical protein